MQDRWELSAEQSPGFGPIAERFRRAGELDRAVDLCREGLARFPNHLSGRVTLGWSLLDLGRYDEARVELERVLKRAPDNLAAIRGLAELHDRAEHVVFVPADPQLAWPPKPDVVDNANGWRDPDQMVTESASATPATAKPPVEPEIAAEDLPALLAELEPGLPARGEAPEAPAPATLLLQETDRTRSDDIDPLVANATAVDATAEESRKDDPDAGLLSLEAAMAELDATAATVPVPDGESSMPVVTEFAAADVTSLDEVLSDLTRAEAGAVADAAGQEMAAEEARPRSGAEPMALVLSAEAGDTVLEIVHDAAAEEVVELTSALFSESVSEALPVPSVDLLEDRAADISADAPMEFEADAVAFAPSIELATDDVEPLFDAAISSELPPQPDDPALEIGDIRPSALASLNLPLAEPAIELDAARPDLDVDLPLDPALFELAEAAAVEHAAPSVERTEEVFDLDPEPQVEIAALEESHEYHEPEPAFRSASAGVDALDRHRALPDSGFDTAALTAGLDMPHMDFHAPEHVSAPPAVRDALLERAFDLSDDLASAMRSGSEFVSPQIAQPEPIEADTPVAVAGLAPPVADSQWCEPEQPAADVDGGPEAAVPGMPSAMPALESQPEPAVAHGAARTAAPDTAVKTRPASPPATGQPSDGRIVRPTNGLERFLRRIERRKAALASDSAA